MEQGIDLFDDVANILMCEYCSDLKLPAYQAAAKMLMQRLDLERYPLGQLWDMAQYLYNHHAPFSSKEEAITFFTSRGSGSP